MESLTRFLMTSPVPPEGVASSLWLIIALPAMGALICGLFGRWLGRANVNLIACASVLGSFLLSLLAFWAINDRSTAVPSSHGFEPVSYALAHDYGVWFSVGGFTARFGLWVDHLSGTMLLVITGVGFLIHLFSTEYMSHDPGYGRYFAYLNLFVAMMLTLVMADNLILTFVGWEGVGLCSYLLIGFWYTDPAKAWAGRKAFVANRVGDFAFIVGACLLVVMVGAFNVQGKENSLVGSRGDQWRQGVALKGPLDYHGLETTARMLSPQPGVEKVTVDDVIAQGPLQGYTFRGVLTVALLLLLLGAAGKSAQLPLYVWLPDAMAGPTPVSALIHAATMVTAGVYLFCRLASLLVLSPLTMATMAIVGALTALLAALIAFAQDDIKKVLAYSTVSQLGAMFVGVGLGVFWAAILHLVTHAFFKACLFLGAGSVMHGNGDETDIKKLGGLRKEMPWTWGTFLVATLAITGLVPLSGFFSKDAILHAIHSTELRAYPWVSTAVWGIALVVGFCTSFYMIRLYLLTFEGRRSAEAKVPHAHESGTAMTFPLLLLASLSVIALVYGLPIMPAGGGQERQVVMENFLGPVFHHARRLAAGTLWVTHTPGMAPLLRAWLLAWAVAIAGSGAAYYVYRSLFPEWGGKPVPAFARAVRRLAVNKFYVDELYDLLIIRPIKVGAYLLHQVVDTFLIDTIAVRGTAWVTYRAGALIRYLQTGDVQSYAAVMAVAVLSAVAYALYLYR